MWFTHSVGQMYVRFNEVLSEALEMRQPWMVPCPRQNTYTVNAALLVLGADYLVVLAGTCWYLQYLQYMRCLRYLRYSWYSWYLRRLPCTWQAATAGA